MRDSARAKAALRRAERGPNELDRSLWLARAAGHAIEGRAVLVGGAAVNMHTQSYRPTDIDMCAHLDESDRQALQDVGFQHQRGDHFSFEFADGEEWLLEFPSSQVDGDVSVVALDDDETLEVISRESLIVDRVLQATDGTSVTFDEALRLLVAVFHDADWARVDQDVRERDRVAPKLKLEKTYSRLKEQARRLLGDLDPM
jgi:hypothetical protein